MINNDSKKDYKSPDFKVFDVRPEINICSNGDGLGGGGNTSEGGFVGED